MIIFWKLKSSTQNLLLERKEGCLALGFILLANFPLGFVQLLLGLQKSHRSLQLLLFCLCVHIRPYVNPQPTSILLHILLVKFITIIIIIIINLRMMLLVNDAKRSEGRINTMSTPQVH